MSEKLEDLMSMSNGGKLAILFGTLLAIFGVYYLAFYSGLSGELSKLDQTINGAKGKEGLQQRVNRQRALAKKLPYFREKKKALDAELAKALAELPDKKEIRQILEKVSDRAKGAGLEILSFKPQAEVKQEFFAENPVSLSVKGSYHQVATFFDEIGNLERIINIDYFKMKHVDDGSRNTKTVAEKTQDGVQTLSAELTATAFRFLDESERPKRDDRAQRRRRKS